MRADRPYQQGRLQPQGLGPSDEVAAARHAGVEARRPGRHQSFDPLEQRRQAVAPRGRDARRMVEHPPAAGPHEGRRLSLRGAGEVRIADDVEHRVIGRQFLGLAGAGVFDEPLDAGVAVGRQQAPIGDVAAVAGGQHQDAGPRCGRPLDVQVAQAEGEVPVAPRARLVAALGQDARQVLVGDGQVGIGGQGQPAVLLGALEVAGAE